MRGPSKNTWIILLVTILSGAWTFGLIQAQEQPSLVGETPVRQPPIPFGPAETPAPDEIPMDRYGAPADDHFGAAQDIAAPPMNMPVDEHGRRIWTNVGYSIRQAAEAVRVAKDDEAKATAEKKLDDILSKYFDEDMARRESELTKIEERLIKLRDLHNRRRAKKQEILELQTKVALNEAEGLGFYDGQSPGPWNASPGPLNADWSSGTVPPVTEAATADPFVTTGSPIGQTYPSEGEDIPTPSQNIPSTGAVIMPEVRPAN
jgi:hypothetical protein